MAEARGKAEWSQTSAMLAMTANVNRDPKKKRRPYTAEDFNPYAQGRRAKRRARPVGFDPRLKAIMVKKGVRCVTRKAKAKVKDVPSTEGKGSAPLDS